MNSGPGSWGGRKGWSFKDTPDGIAGNGLQQNTKSYGNSDLLAELNSIVGRFTNEQCRIAESTGFAAFAKPVHALLFDRQFTVWLLTKVDTLTKSIGTNCGKRLIVFQEDVTKFFGIPFAGKDVWDASLDKSQTMRNEIDSLIGMDNRNQEACTRGYRTKVEDKEEVSQREINS
jgi:hypothetical protein